MLILCGAASAQTFNNTQLPIVNAAHGGTGIDTSSATGCVRITSGVWSYSPSNCGGTTTFSGLLGGTNTSAAMLVGSGSSLGYTGSGTIAASTWAGYSLAGSATTGYVPTISGTGAMTLQALPASGITALTGDVTASGSGSVAATLATVYSGTPCNTISGLYWCIDPKGRTVSLGIPFSATFGCSQCGTWEFGYTISSASGTISYANPTVPTSASVSDGTNTVTLTTPFTSWTESHTYTASLTPTVFTLTAVGNGQTVTPTQSFTGAYATFSGLTTGGTASGATAGGSATGGVCANETVMLTGLTGTLSCNGLGNTYAGQSFSFPTPGGSYISLLLTGGCGHTLTVGGFTTTFFTHALTYTNIETGSQTGMCAYTSPAPASIATTVVVQSL